MARDYDIDYGKLAYIKIEDMQARLAAFEAASKKNKGNLLEFSADEPANLSLFDNYTEYSFNACRPTGAAFEINLTLASLYNCRCEIYLFVNSVFCEKMSFLANSGEFKYNFMSTVAGIPEGNATIGFLIKIASDENIGNFAVGMQRHSLTVSGNYIEYISKKITARVSGNVLLKNTDGKGELFEISDALSKINPPFPFSQISDLIVFSDKIILFRHDAKKLFADIYDMNYLKQKTVLIAENAENIYAQKINGNLGKLYYIKSKKLYEILIDTTDGIAFFEDGGAVKDNVTDINYYQAANKAFLLLCDTKKQNKLYLIDNELYTNADMFDFYLE